MRQVWIDADACPRNVMRFLRDNESGLGYLLWTVASVNHQLQGERHLVADPEPEAVDMVIINRVQPGDIVVTQDWGLAAVVLSKGALALSPVGLVYSRERMSFMLEQRHLLAKHRRGGGRTKGPSARGAADDERFKQSFVNLLAGSSGKNEEDSFVRDDSEE